MKRATFENQRPHTVDVAVSVERAAEFVKDHFPVMAVPLDENAIGPANVLCLTTQAQFDRAVPSFFEKVPGARIVFVRVEHGGTVEAAIARAEEALLTFANSIFGHVLELTEKTS